MLMNSLNVVMKSKLPNIILEYHNIYMLSCIGVLWSPFLSVFAKRYNLKLRLRWFYNLTIYYHSAELTVLKLIVFEK